MPASPRNFTLTLNDDDVGQLLDGLRLRVEAWTRTADYLESGFNPDEAFICEECSDPREARYIAQHYRRIVTEIERQIKHCVS